MVKQLTILFSLLAAGVGLFVAPPAQAATLQPVTADWGTNGMPTNVSMYIYVPDNVVTNPPILVLLHYWGGTAASVFGQAAGGGIVAAADQYGFIMVVPQRASDCWDYGSAQSLTHDGGGETHAIAQMVRYAITHYHANADRVYVTGDSCGGMMTEAMLAVYPDIFKAGTAYAGVPVGGQWAPVTHTAQQWGDLVRACYPGYAGRRPRVQLWHGSADSLVNSSNLFEAIMQWGNVQGLSPDPTTTTTETIPNVTNQWTHQVWKDACGNTLLDAWLDIGGDHGPSDSLFRAQYVIPFLGLDHVGPTDPVSPCVSVPAYSQIEAESFTGQSGGIQTGSCSEGGQDITGIQHGSFVVYQDVDFSSGAASFQARVASTNGGIIGLHLDSPTGVQIGSCVVTNTGGQQTWVTQSCPVGGAAGLHDLYLKFIGGTGLLFNANWWRFNSTAGVDVGAVGVAGGGSSSNGVFTVAGAGADIQGTADAFHFVHVSATGDCAMVARVSSEQNTDPWAKAGVMIRESLAPDAVNAFIALTPGNGVSWQYRLSTGGGTTFNNTGGLNAPYWVKLVRSGNAFTAYRSTDSTTWTQQGTATINMAATVCIGLAVTSHNDASLCTATFDNVIAPGWLAALAPAPTGLVATVASSTQVNLAWNASADASSYALNRSTNSGGPYTTIATGVTATDYTDASVSVSAGCYYVISAVVGGSETPNSAEAVPVFPKLAGAIIGTPGSWNNAGDTIARVFDSNLNTFFDGPTANGCWAGLDFGAGVSNVITKINYCPRTGFADRMPGGVFEGANQANFSGAVTLASVTTQPAEGGFTSVTITNTAAFRYARYLSPNNGYGNVAEVEFHGYAFSSAAPTLPAPTGLAAEAISSSQINLAWNTLSNATSYIVKRSLTNGGPYTEIASGVTATNYADSSLAGGTIYYYVVSAMLDGSETADSTQAAATTLSPTVGSLVHRYSFSETGGSTVADSVGGPVWNGTLPNGGTLAGGQLALASSALQYATLPAGIVSSMSNVTVMAWVNLASVTYWSRLFDFGNDTTSYMYLTPRNGFDYTARFSISTSGAGGEQKINCTAAVNPSAWHQVAVSLNAGTGILYVDGVAIGTNSSLTLNPSNLGSTTNNYLGRSQSGSEPCLNGALDEFRIYNAGLSSAEIAATVALGPEQQLSTNRPALNLALVGTNLTLSWPLANAGFTLQTCTNLVSGDWQTVTLPAPQIVGVQWQVTVPQATDQSLFYRLTRW